MSPNIIPNVTNIPAADSFFRLGCMFLKADLKQNYAFLFYISDMWFNFNHILILAPDFDMQLSEQ